MFLLSMVRRPPCVMASRAMNIRLSRLISNWRLSTAIGHKSSFRTERILIVSPSFRLSRRESRRTILLGSTGSGSSPWRLPNARRRCTNSLPLSAEDRESSISSRLVPWLRNFSRNRSRFPMITASRLLKSWAMPHANWPRASVPVSRRGGRPPQLSGRTGMDSDDVARRMANPHRDADAAVMHARSLPAAGKFTRVGRRERSLSSRLGSLYSSRLLMTIRL